MNQAVARRTHAISFAIVSSMVLLAEWIVVRSIAFREQPELIAIAVTFDIVTVIPLLFYFLVLRPKQHSPLFAIPCFVICNLIASRFLPSTQQAYLQSLEIYLIPVLELALLVFVFSRLPLLRKAYRAERPKTIYFTDAFLSSLQSVLGRNPLLAIVAVETLLVVFSFGGWFLRWKDTGEPTFTYYKKGGYTAILGILLFVGVTETVALHLILSRWSLMVAWILTGLSLYWILWIVGDFHAIRLHPLVLRDGILHLRTGLRWRADIPVSRITDVQIGGPKSSKAKSYLRASVLWPRAVIQLNEPMTVEGLFGLRKTAMEIGVSVDEPELFRRAL